MERRRHTYDNGKVGENVLLPVSFFDSDGAALSVSSVRVWIKRVGKAVVANEWATLTSDSSAEFDWVPTIPAAYVVEWVAYDSDGRITKSVTCDIEIEPAVGTDAPATAATPPTTLPHWVLPGEYSVPEGAAVGQLVAITAAGVAETYATRASGGNAADAIVYQLLSATTARLARICTLDAFVGLTPGAPLYLGVDGAVSHTPSTTEDEVDQLVGEAETTTRASLWTVDRSRIVPAAEDLAEHIADASDPHAAAGYALDADLDAHTGAANPHSGSAPLASPALTGTPTAPTAAPGTDTTQVATTGFVKAAIDAVKNGVSAAFDTLAEIATELAGKLSLSGGRMTGRLGGEAPFSFTVSAGAASLDVSAHNDFAQSNTMTATTVLTMTGGADGDQGTVMVEQDSTGRTVTFVHASRTVEYAGGSIPSTAAASKRILCSYWFNTKPSGTAYLSIFPVVMG